MENEKKKKHCLDTENEKKKKKFKCGKRKNELKNDF